MTEEQIVETLEYKIKVSCDNCDIDDEECCSTCVYCLIKQVIAFADLHRIGQSELIADVKRLSIMLDATREKNNALELDNVKLKEEQKNYKETIEFLHQRLQREKAEAIKEFAKEHREMAMMYCDDDDQISMKVCEYDVNTKTIMDELKEGVKE